jgi:3-deoxy-D-manno-octulosonic-acid transferase
MQQIYNVGIYFFSFLVKVYSKFNLKAKKLLVGQKVTINLLDKGMDGDFVWIHAASLGEFEQGKPLIEFIRSKYPNQKILLSFFSPSGYEAMLDFKLADKIIYLPFDTISNTELFFKKTKIKVAIFIKYEFWFNYLQVLQEKNIPTFYVSTNFRKGHIYFRFNWMKNILKKLNHIFVQSEESKLIGLANGIKNISVSGDTRLDSAIANSKKEFHCKEIEIGLDHRKVIILGSAWEGDYKLMASFIRKHANKYQYIIAPHELNVEKISAFVTSINVHVSFLSKCETLKDVLIVDTIGVLKYLYRYADLALVGGGYDKGIHNTLEPIVYGLPVLFGPKDYEKFPEAEYIEVNQIGGVTETFNYDSRLDYFLNSEDLIKMVREKVDNYLKENKGATEKVMDKLGSLLES